MNYTTDQRRKLWGILASLAAAVTIAVVLDTIPLNPPTADVLENPTDTSTSVDTSLPDTTPTTTEPPLESEPAETTPVTPAPDTSFVLTFLGECAPGSPLGTDSFGSLNELAKAAGDEYFFSELRSLLSTDDLTVASNNCIFTDGDASSVSGCAAPASQVNVFKAGSIGFMSLASPLLSEYEPFALEDTKASIEAAGLRYAEHGQISHFEDAGIRVAIVCLQLKTNVSIADDLDLIRQAKDSSEYVIVYFWDGDSDSHTPEEWLKTSLRSFADAGASLIVGCGNGVLRPVEQYGDVTIAYSLGTALDGSALYHQNATALLRVVLSRDETGALQQDVLLIPCYVYEDHWQPRLITDEEDKNRLNAFLSGETDTPILSDS